MDDDLAEGDVVEADLSNRPNQRPNREPNQMWMLKLDRLRSGMARLDPAFSSMIDWTISGVVEGPVVLEIGLKDVAKAAQLDGVVVLGPTDGCSERAERVTTFSA